MHYTQSCGGFSLAPSEGERRPLRSTCPRDGLEENPAGRDLWAVIAKNSRASSPQPSKGGADL